MDRELYQKLFFGEHDKISIGPAFIPPAPRPLGERACACIPACYSLQRCVTNILADSTKSLHCNHFRNRKDTIHHDDGIIVRKVLPYNVGFETKQNQRGTCRRSKNLPSSWCCMYSVTVFVFLDTDPVFLTLPR
jgi:hypothetical protein